MKLLLVEDDVQIAEKLRTDLEEAGHMCHWAEDLASGLAAEAAQKPEMVLLDLMLPDGTGFEFIEAVRSRSLVPIIVLTAKLLSDDKIKALDLGADDYVTKPFWSEEVLARMRAVMRRHSLVPRPGMMRRFGSVVVDLTAMRASADGQDLALTPTEFDLLAFFLQRPGEALRREQIAYKVLESEEAGPDALSIHISRLRQKLGAEGGRIKTVWGIGYLFNGGESQ